MFLVRQKYVCSEKKTYFFNEETKNDKKFEFEKLKIPNPDIWPFWEIFNFSNSIFLSFLVSSLKKYVFFSEQTYFCLTKNIFGTIALIEKKIYYKR